MTDHMPAPDQAVVGGSSQPTVPASALTAREYEALAAYARTGNREEAAQELGIAVPTMRRHLVAIYRKLDVQTSTDAFRAMGWLVAP